MSPVEERLAAMSNSGRMPHTVIFLGNDKTDYAKYLASLLICENPVSGRPCGVCRQCKRVESSTHPDVIEPEKSGKLNVYTRDTMRGVCSDAYIKPNDTDSKIYIFRDFENTEPASQNVLLKIIEDPPGNVHFIFTAGSAGSILETILSRAALIQLPEVENDDPEVTQTAERLITALKRRNEYDFASALASVGESKDKLREVLAETVKNLPRRESSSYDVYTAMEKAAEKLKFNVNVGLLTAALTAEIFSGKST